MISCAAMVVMVAISRGLDWWSLEYISIMARSIGPDHWRTPASLPFFLPSGLGDWVTHPRGSGDGEPPGFGSALSGAFISFFVFESRGNISAGSGDGAWNMPDW